MGAMGKFEKISPYLSIGGSVLSFFNIFEPSDLEILLDAIEKISKQIAYLQQDMNYYFNKVLQAIH